MTPDATDTPGDAVPEPTKPPPPSPGGKTSPVVLAASMNITLTAADLAALDDADRAALYEAVAKIAEIRGNLVGRGA